MRNEELGIGDGVGFIMDFICGVVERYAGDFILQFLCVMSGIYWHLTRMGAHCAPANLNRQYFFQWSRIGQTATRRCSSSSPPYKRFAGLRQLLSVSLRRDEGIAPYNFFIVRLTFQKAQSPNIFERHVCAAVHHNDSLFFFQAKNASRPGPTVRREAF